MGYIVCFHYGFFIITANIRCGYRPPDAYGFIDWSCHVDLIDFCWLYDGTSAVATYTEGNLGPLWSSDDSI